MAGIFPASTDGGLPPNPGNSTNPSHAYLPAKLPLDTTALYYGNGCDVRLRPEVLNSLISEVAAICDRVHLPYQSGLLTNLRSAVEYIVQRGIPCYAVGTGGPFVYTAAMSPPCLAYNDGMVVIVLPAITNQGATSVNLDGVGLVPVLRNDGQQLQSKDWLAHIPQPIAFYQGNFYQLGLVSSQVPLLAGPLDVWVRTDGSDVTGDGSANTPAAAFMTIQHAWNVVAGRYAATPLTVINIRLGIPGTYAGASFSSYGGSLAIWGDPTGAAPDNYKIAGVPTSPVAASLGFGAVTTVRVTGVCCLIDQPYPVFHEAISFNNGTTGIINRCNFQANIDNSNAGFLQSISSSFMYVQGNLIFRGQNHTLGTAVAVTQTSGFQNATSTDPSSAVFQDMILGNGFFIAGTATGFLPTTVSNSNTHGPKYGVSGNSILYMNGQQPPGDVAGSVAYNGQAVP